MDLARESPRLAIAIAIGNEVCSRRKHGDAGQLCQAEIQRTHVMGIDNFAIALHSFAPKMHPRLDAFVFLVLGLGFRRPLNQAAQMRIMLRSATAFVSLRFVRRTSPMRVPDDERAECGNRCPARVRGD